LLLLNGRVTLSSHPLRSCASRQNLPTSPPRFSGFLPLKKPCPFSLPKCLARVGTACSLELSDLSGSPSANPSKRASPSPRSPLALETPSPYEPNVSAPQGLPGPAAWLSPLTGAGLSGLPNLVNPPTSSDDPQVMDYFFISKSPEALQPQRSFSKPPTATLLTEGWTAPRSPT
jgi:hypothetical protein